jgi:hypothetical protein
MIRSVLPLSICIALTASVVLGGCHMDCQCEAGSPSLENRQKWHDYLQLTDASPGAPIATTQTQISNVSPDMASAKMNQALEAYETDLGFRLTTVFQVGEASGEFEGGGIPAITDVVVGGHYYYIAPLDYPGGDHGAFTQTGGIIPAIAVVDAEDETVPAWIRTADEDGNPYEIVLRFESQEVVDEGTIFRWLRSNEYRTYCCHRLDDPTLEVDDSWRPYYTATYVNNDGCMNVGEAFYPEVLLVVDAQTKEIQEFALDDPNTSGTDETSEDVPVWVDRIYSEQLILDWIAYWGYNVDNYGKTSNLDEFVVDGNDLDMVMNADNTNLVFVAYITSMYQDNSVIGTMLIDPRTGKATMYWNTGVASAMATKSTAENAILQATSRWGFEVEDLTLHTIYGVRTWEGVLTRPAYKNFDDLYSGTPARYGSLYAGTVMAEANFDLKPANVIWADDKHETFTKYEAHLYLQQGGRAGSNVLDDREVRGVVENIDEIVIDGDTHYIIRLADHPGEVWDVPLTYIGDPRNEDVLRAKNGDSIHLQYGDPQNRSTYLVREVKLLPAAG